MLKTSSAFVYTGGALIISQPGVINLYTETSYVATKTQVLSFRETNTEKKITKVFSKVHNVIYIGMRTHFLYMIYISPEKLA